MPVNPDIAKELILAAGAFSNMHVGAPLPKMRFNRDGEKRGFLSS